MTAVKRLWLAALLLGAATLGAAAQSSQDRTPPFNEDLRIVGGEVVSDARAWPWQIAIYANVSGRLQFVCGGSIIADHWVLTAAHCILGKPEQTGNFAVVEGELLIDLALNGQPTHGGRKLAVKRIIVHEGYNANRSENDIALIELATPAQSTPVPYARSANAAAVETPSPDRPAVVTGWGLQRGMKWDDQGNAVDIHTGQKIPNDQLDQYRDNKLRQVEVPLVDTQACRAAYEKVQRAIDPRNICAGGLPEGGKDSCNGDSGGPLVGRDEKNFFVQIGIVSWGTSDCGSPGVPGVYTRVSAFERWLADKTGIRQDEPSQETQQVVDGLAGMGNRAGLSVTIAQGTRLRIGQKTQFRVTTRQPGYLLLFDVTPDGAVTQIFPNERSLRTATGRLVNANRVDVGRTLLVPNPGNPYEGFELDVDGPVGEGRVVGVLTLQPMKWLNSPQMPRSFESRNDALGYLATLGRLLDRGVVVEGKDNPSVSVAITPYSVVQ
jgi:secreted trypsin-like serine protease